MKEEQTREYDKNSYVFFNAVISVPQRKNLSLCVELNTCRFKYTRTICRIEQNKKLVFLFPLNRDAYMLLRSFPLYSVHRRHRSIHGMHECVEYRVIEQLLLLMVSYRCRSCCRYCLVLGAVLHFDITGVVVVVVFGCFRHYSFVQSIAYIHASLCLIECSGVQYIRYDVC